MYGLETSVHHPIYKAEGISQSMTSQDNQIQSHLLHSWNSNEEGQLANFPDAQTVRLLMSGKEVGSIIGKKGVNIKKYREESGARINISDGTTPERIVTIIGNAEQIQSALSLMCHKFEEDLQQNLSDEERSQGSVPPLTLRLLVPGAQCGSIIGKGGCKIREIRETTSASIQVASDVLPQSTERVITVSGTAKAISQCIKILCETIQMCSNKVPIIPYKPKPVLGMNVLLPGALSPSFLPGAASLAANFGAADFIKGLVPTAAPLNVMAASQTPDSTNNMALAAVQQSAALSHSLSAAGFLPLSINVNGTQQMVAANPFAAVAASLFPGLHGLALSQPNLAALSAGGFPLNMLGPPGAASSTQGQHTQDLVIPNELIGCVIGRGGNKINEIRQASGAQIKISNVESGGGRDRKITMSGSSDQVQLARILIQQSIEAHRQMLALNVLASGAAKLGASIPFGGLHNPVNSVENGITSSVANVHNAYFNPPNAASLTALLSNSNNSNSLFGDLYSTSIQNPQTSFLNNVDWLQAAAAVSGAVSHNINNSFWIPTSAASMPTTVSSGSATTLIPFSLTGPGVQQSTLNTGPTSSGLFVSHMNTSTGSISTPVQTSFVSKMKAPLSASSIPKYSPY